MTRILKLEENHDERDDEDDSLSEEYEENQSIKGSNLDVRREVSSVIKRNKTSNSNADSISNKSGV